MSISLELLELAEKSARATGELLLQRPKKFDLDQKSGVFDFATQMDLASEKLIIELISQSRPSDGFLGEEGASKKSESGFTWVIDPIDGTVNYLYGLPGWCISIAVRDHQDYVAGVVYSPATNSFWKASRGGGAFLNDEKISCNEPVSLSRALIGTGFAYDVARREEQARLTSSLLPKIRDIRRLGACAVDISLVASGGLDGYFEAGVNEWDFAAAGLIAREAGARLTIREGIWGDKRSMVICSGPSLHSEFLAALNQA